MEKQYCVYILSSKMRGTLYVGVASDLIKRTWEHKEKLADGFSKRDGLNQFVYFEAFGDIEKAIFREKK